MTGTTEGGGDKPPTRRGEFDLWQKELPSDSHVFFFVTSAKTKGRRALDLSQQGVMRLYPILTPCGTPELDRQTGEVREYDQGLIQAAKELFMGRRLNLNIIQPNASLNEFTGAQAINKLLNVEDYQISVSPALLIATDTAGEIADHSEIKLEKHLSPAKKRQALSLMQGKTIRISTAIILARWTKEGAFVKPPDEKASIKWLGVRAINLEVDIRGMNQEEIDDYLKPDEKGKHETDHSGLGGINLLGKRCQEMELIKEIRRIEPDGQVSKLSPEEAKGIIIGYPHLTIKEMLNEHYPDGFVNNDLTWRYSTQVDFHPEFASSSIYR